MPFFIRVIRILLISIATLVSNESFAQNNRVHQEAVSLLKSLEKNHYSPRIVDDSLSKEIFENFIDALDPQQLFFSNQDIGILTRYKYTLDNELKGSFWQFLPFISDLYREKLLAAKKICENITGEPFDFTKKEKVSFGNSEKTFAADQDALMLRWHKKLKYQTMWQLLKSSGNDKASSIENYVSKEPEARKFIAKIELRKINKILEHPLGYHNYLKTLYFNSITSCYDPHTNYLSGTEFQNIKSRLSAGGLYFGFELDENETGEIEITRIVPGGPAWKSNELYKGDILLKLKWQNKPEQDLLGADLTEVEEMLEASNTDILELTVRGTGGNIKTTKLKKEKISDDENIVKSLLLTGRKTIGYISLPGFYTEWDNEDGLGCANDVAKELVKLKKEKIDGLILDLRFNGGGSLHEGINLAGLFIDEGPLLLNQGQDKKIKIVKDPNRGTAFDAPLIVLVNGLSASASELLASTLQDYNRAIIVGTKSFGKSTGQAILPLNPSPLDKKDSNGFLKVTMYKIFRVTGKTAQLEGVQPDIKLPDIFEALRYREENLPNSISNEYAQNKIAFNQLPAIPVSYLREKSHSRLGNHQGFQKIGEYLSTFNKEPEAFEAELTFDLLTSLLQKTPSFEELIGDIKNEKTSNISVELPKFNHVFLNLDADQKELNERLKAKIQSDIYIEESIYILEDYIDYLIKTK